MLAIKLIKKRSPLNVMLAQKLLKESSPLIVMLLGKGCAIFESNVSVKRKVEAKIRQSE